MFAQLIAERFTNLLDGEVHALFEIDACVVPQLRPDLLAGHEFAYLARQQTEQLERLRLKVDETTVFEKLFCLQIQLEGAKAKQRAFDLSVKACSGRDSLSSIQKLSAYGSDQVVVLPRVAGSIKDSTQQWPPNGHLPGFSVYLCVWSGTSHVAGSFLEVPHGS
jgi:hypothetical protein